MPLLSKNWDLIRERIKNGYWSPFLAKLLRPIYSRLPNRGVRVVEQEWDYLIVLDACRYDTFEEVNWLDGDLKKARSRGSSSTEWLKENFTEFYDDIAYVSANAFVSPTDHGDFRSDEHFPEVFPVFMNPRYEKAGAATPEAVNSKVKQIDNDFPDKRKIIHYIQPHGPFIGDKNLEKGDIGIEKLLQDYDVSEIRGAYRSNLEYVLEGVERLLPYLEGKIVITADHGQAFGEKGFYAHPPGIHTSELVEVPWFEIEKQQSVEKESIEGIDL